MVSSTTIHPGGAGERELPAAELRARAATIAPPAVAPAVEVRFEGRPCWAEVSLDAIARNLRAIRQHIGGKRKILAIVKADAYGHGAVAVSRALADAGADWFGVTSVAEGAELREAGIRQPVLVLSGFWPGEENHLVGYGLTPAITDAAQLRYLEDAVARVRRGPNGVSPLGFHLKIDSGMHRLGLAPENLGAFAGALADCLYLKMEGTFTHFASSEDFSSAQTAEQESVFAAALSELRRRGVRPGIVHLANSAAIASRPTTWADMVRPGALLYGYHQFYEPAEREAQAADALPLAPALSLRARIIALRELPAGASVGYNARFVAARPSRIGILAAGYADGLVRRLTGSGCVLVRGKRVPLVGTISMDLAAVDLTDAPEAALGDVATIFGADGGDTILPSDVARQLGTVTADILCSIGKRVPRFCVR